MWEVPLKQFNTLSRISLEKLEQCSLNLGPEMYITKETKSHLSCCCHDNSYAAGSVLIKTKIPIFYLKQGSSTANNLMGRITVPFNNMQTLKFKAQPINAFFATVNQLFGSSSQIPTVLFELCSTI